MKLSSSAFVHEGNIPDRFTCQGDNINPPLTLEEIPTSVIFRSLDKEERQQLAEQFTLEEIPDNAQSLCVLMHDPDAPSSDFVHWVDYDIDPIEEISEGASVGRQGMNSFDRVGYGGPCPSNGTHRYYFDVFALDTKLGLPEGKSRSEVESAMRGHILDSAELMGKYEIRQ